MDISTHSIDSIGSALQPDRYRNRVRCQAPGSNHPAATNSPRSRKLNLHLGVARGETPSFTPLKYDVGEPQSVESCLRMLGGLEPAALDGIISGINVAPPTACGSGCPIEFQLPNAGKCTVQADGGEIDVKHSESECSPSPRDQLLEEGGVRWSMGGTWEGGCNVK